ncbi:dockerin type I domain-containing protein [Candidatus Poribacteria bacterium]
MSRSISIVTVFFCILLCHPFAYALSMVNTGLNELYYADGQRYFLYVPDSVLKNPEEAHILAAIHGYSGRKDDAEGISTVEYTALRWSSLAEEYGWVVLAPHFDEDRFNDAYQRLNLSIFGIGVRSDLRLNELAQEVGRLIPGIDSRKMHLFGFSGGGQFVHRYVAFHPERVLRAVSAGSGWYMWPDDGLPYPVGTTTLLHGAEPRIDELLTSNLLVLVGEEDTTDSSFRRTYGFYDLMKMQGGTRWERAQNWVNELGRIARRRSIDLKVELEFAASTGHTISYTLKKIAAEYLTEDSIPIAIRLSPWDVDQDGIVGISDLTIVGSHLGEAVTTALEPNPDVNSDGRVDVLDIVMVAKHFGEIYSSAAPARKVYDLDPYHRRLIVGLYNMMADSPDSDPDFLTAKRLLHRLIADFGTAGTEVFQNYPNPFNPETWIPYQLAEDSAVAIRIYSATGQMIKDLELGYRKAGSYLTRDKAAYWDGTTETGEYAPSGVYFSHLHAGNSGGIIKLIITR